MAAVALFFSMFLSHSAFGAASAELDLKKNEDCATIVLALTKNNSITVNKRDPKLQSCSESKSKTVCSKANELMEKSASNQGKMPPCKGTQVADLKAIKINITMPDGSSNFYMSTGNSPSSLRENADANFNFLRARGFKPVFDLGN
jgi:hypothetical protein